MILNINSNSKFWKGNVLLSKFPPMNHFAWRYGVSGRTEADREADRFFIANTEYPIIDPWRRPLLKWTHNNDETEHEWMPCTESENAGYSYRYVSVQKKFIKLFLPIPGGTFC